ncbi:unnamed protein product, partial [Polarella glacialis]
MVDQFDPSGLRLTLLRRIAESQSPYRPQEGPGVLARCAGELQQWFCVTPVARLGRRLLFRTTASSLSLDPAAQACSAASAPSGGSSAEGAVGGPSALPGSDSRCPSASLPPQRSTAGVSTEDSRSHVSACSCPPEGATFPARAICRHLCSAMRQLTLDLKVMLFLSLPRGSPYEDRNVENLFQWHYTRRWWLCLDWSTFAVLLMLVWDVAMNPPYRVTLVLLFYATFGVGLLMRKVLIFAAPSPPMRRR